MEEALSQDLAGLLRELRRVAVLLEEVADELVDVRSLGTGPDGGEREVERVLAEPVPLAQLVGGLADDEGARPSA
jgi:hypothetical protein